MICHSDRKKPPNSKLAQNAARQPPDVSCFSGLRPHGLRYSIICNSAEPGPGGVLSVEKVAYCHFFEFFSCFASRIRSPAAKPAKYENL